MSEPETQEGRRTPSTPATHKSAAPARDAVDVSVQRASDDHRGIGYTGWTGCPVGCRRGQHEPPCSVGRPIARSADWDEAPVGIEGPDGPRLVSVREYRQLHGAAA